MKINLVYVFMLVGCLFTTVAGAQITAGNPNFNEGDLDVNVGLGLARTYYSYTSTVVPPLSVSAEYGLSDKISVGGFLGFSTAKEDWYGGEINYSFLIIGARGSYHLTVWDKLDTYAGLMLGYNIVSASFDDTFGDYLDDYSVAASGMALSAYIGGRYGFNEQLSGFVEIGYGISVLNLGVSFKL